MVRFHLLRVFCDDTGRGGNPLAIFLDGPEVPPGQRQAVAATLGLSETVFVDDPERGELQIFTPAVEMEFAGHPTVGSAWLLRERGVEPAALRVPAGELAVRFHGAAAFVAARPEWGPPHQWERVGSPQEVDALDGPPRDEDLIGAWAWLDEGAGVLRARVFLPGLGIDEDEATGSAAVRLCARLGRPLDIRQGRNSRIFANPLAEGLVEIGGLAVLDEERDYPVSNSGPNRGS